MTETGQQRRFDGKVTLVTGGSSGIGRAIARLLGARGSRIVPPWSRAADRGPELASQAAEEITVAGAEVELVEADVTETGAITHMLGAAGRRFGAVDHVINCAAIIMTKPVIEVTEADYDRMFGVNARGASFVLREAARRVREGGRIIACSMLLDFWRERGPSMSPFNRLGEPLDVAAAVCLLLQPEAHWLTGQTNFAGGGAYMG